jgi:hypothetical protein
MWSSDAINQDKKMLSYISSERAKAIVKVKAALGAWEYHQIQEIQDNLRRQRLYQQIGALEEAIQNRSPWTLTL